MHVSHVVASHACLLSIISSSSSSSSSMPRQSIYIGNSKQVCSWLYKLFSCIRLCKSTCRGALNLQLRRRCSPSTWILYALAVNQLGNREDQVTGFDGNLQTIHDFMRNYFGYKYEFRWYAVLIIAAYLVAFRVAAMLALKYISFQRR